MSEEQGEQHDAAIFAAMRQEHEGQTFDEWIESDGMGGARLDFEEDGTQWSIIVEFRVPSGLKNNEGFDYGCRVTAWQRTITKKKSHTAIETQWFVGSDDLSSYLVGWSERRGWYAI